MKALVTGGAGFIGSHLVDALLAKGHEVIIFDNLSGAVKIKNPKAEFVGGDIRDSEKLKGAMKGVDWVFHLAAEARVPFSVDHPLESNDINVVGTLKVLLTARDAGVKKYVFSSSAGVYGSAKELPRTETLEPKPLSPYALQKYVGEIYARQFAALYGLRTVSLRFSNVYGPRTASGGAYDPVIAKFIRNKAENKPLIIEGDGEQRRDFVHVYDVAAAVIAAAESNKTGGGEVINIGFGKNYSINEVAKMIGGEFQHGPPRPGDVREDLADISLAKKLLGWSPKIKLEDGIKTLTR